MKIRIWLSLLLFSSFLYSQSFPYEDNLLKPLDKKTLGEIKNALFDQFSFGNLIYYLQWTYFQPSIGEQNRELSLEEKIRTLKNSIVRSSTVQDSLKQMLDLYRIFQATGKYSTADSISVVIAGLLNRELSKENNISSWLLTYIGKWQEVCNKDLNEAHQYYQRALQVDSLDTTAFSSLLTFYARYGYYELADSLFLLGIKRYKNFNMLEFVPMLVSASFTKVIELFSYAQQIQHVCLSHVIQMDLLDKLEHATYPQARSVSTLSKLMYYVGRYGLLLTQNNKPVTPLACDQDSLTAIKKRIMAYLKDPVYGKSFIFDESLGWIYMLSNQPDSSLYWFSKAQTSIDSYGVMYYDKHYTIQFAKTYVLLAFKKDTLAAIGSMENIIKQKQKLGVYPQDYLLLAKWYAAKKMYAKALAMVDSFFTFPVGKTDAKLLKATILYLDKQKNKAFEEVNQTIEEIGLASSKPYLIAALLYLLNNQPAEAYRYLLSGFALDPQNRQIVEVAGRYYKPKKVGN